MLFFNKLLPVFVLPLGIVGLLLLFALWRKQRWPVVAALGVLYAASIPFTGNRLLGWLESRHPAVRIAEAGPADAVVVLGGILGPPAAAGFMPNWAESVERFDAGVTLVQAGRADRLVFTGARIAWEQRTTTEGAELKTLAVARGVAAEKILVTRDIDNTATEAAAVAGLMREHNWRRIILVTTGWHMPRSAYLFRKAGVDCVLFPVDFRFDRSRPLAAIDFVPKAEAWQVTETALREIYGNLFYRIFR
ncbi:MAG: YdcF family protein [Lacunisphaera sp.]|nr:YdcF family protein [Lacunisphaera sp.]